jgi:hypothetical protein
MWWIKIEHVNTTRLCWRSRRGFLLARTQQDANPKIDKQAERSATVHTVCRGMEGGPWPRPGPTCLPVTPFPRSANPSNLKTESVDPSETSVTIQQSIQRHTPRRQYDGAGCSSGNPLDFYSEGTGLESRQDHQLTEIRCVCRDSIFKGTLAKSFNAI